MLRSEDLLRYRAASSSAAAFALTAGMTTRATLEGAGHTLVNFGPHNGVRRRSLFLTPFGSGSDNQTFDFRLWLFRYIRANGTLTEPAMVTQIYGFGTATLGTGVGLSGGVVTDSERFADTISWNVADSATSPVGVGGHLETCLGILSDKYSPANNTPGMIIVPDVGNAAGFIFETDLTGASGANCLYEIVDR